MSVVPSAGSSPPRRGERHLDPEIGAALVFLAFALAGWLASAPPLAIAGALGALTATALYVWQRQCLAGLGYHRVLSRDRADFGERVELTLELVNDKLLPLSWLQLEDDVPAALGFEGATVRGADGISRRATLVDIRPMLPFQRVRRRVVVACDRRGEHVFGPATLTSGDPLGLRQRVGTVPDRSRLLVYPKLFALEPAGFVSRLLLGEQRSRRELVEDPSRVAGVRAYRPGDPLRNVDWRASARTSGLLVREFEPTVALEVALVLDVGLPARRIGDPAAISELEFAVAVAASLVVELDRIGVPTALYATGSVGGHPLALPTRAAAAAGIAGLLEALAKLQTQPRVSLAALVAGEGSRLARGASVLVLANDFAGQSAGALAELRRRHAVTACLAGRAESEPPPPGCVDRVVVARLEEDWASCQVLELST